MSLLYAQMGRPRDQRTATKQARLLHGDDLGSAYIAVAKKLLPLNAAPLVEWRRGEKERCCTAAARRLGNSEERFTGRCTGRRNAEQGAPRQQQRRPAFSSGERQ